MADQGTIKFQIRAAAQSNEKLFLRSNYSANADILLDKRLNVVAINEGNLMVEEGKQFVEIEIGLQEYKSIEIQTGRSDGINIEVVKGLKEGDKIKRR